MENQINNISNTNITSDSGSYARLYGSTLRYDTLVPSIGYITNDVNNTNTLSTNIACTNLSTINANMSFLNVSNVSYVSISCLNFRYE